MHTHYVWVAQYIRSIGMDLFSTVPEIDLLCDEDTGYIDEWPKSLKNLLILLITNQTCLYV